MPSRRDVLLGFAAALLLPGFAAAQQVHEGKGPNGGIIADIPTGHVEFVVSEQKARLYIYDVDMKPALAAGAEVNVTIQGKAGRDSFKMVQAGSNRLEGTGSFAPEPGLRAIVAVKMPGQQVVQIRYSL